jgi:hypothetical protein
LLALRVGSECSWAMRDSEVFSCSVGVGRRTMPISAAERAIGLADVAAWSPRQHVVDQLVDVRNEEVHRIGHRLTSPPGARSC